MTEPALLPAEAFVMLDPAKRRGKETLKVALMALLAQRIVLMKEEERKLLGMRAKHGVVELAANVPMNLPGPMRAVCDIVRDIQPDGRISAFVRKAQARFGAGFNGFETEVILPALATRGLAAEAIEPFLGFLKRKVWRATPAGEQVRRELEAKLAQARQLPRMFDENPREAAAMVVALGALILLAPELQGYYGHIARAMRQGGDDGDSSIWAYDTLGPYHWNTSHDPARTHQTPQDAAPSGAAAPRAADGTSIADFSALDFGALDLAAFDTLDTSLSAFDSSFDSASGGGDGGGGDSGGGDGGGGGD